MGQPVSTLGDKTTGHGPYKPRANNAASGNVKVNGKGVIRMGDGWNPHTPPPPDIHAGETNHTTTVASTKVFANGKGIARIGDSVEDDTIAAGSTNVFAG
jgi:uncharacterized Zn-binding protein involved in type VI secretion